MEHTARDGSPKIVRACALPLTGRRAVDRSITELAVFDVGPDGLHPVELGEGATVEAVRGATSPRHSVADGLH